MKREYPSTPEEAFEASLEGAYYADQLAAAELQGRVGDFPAEPGVPVDTRWDIGIGDYTSDLVFSTPRPTASGLCIICKTAARACRITSPSCRGCARCTAGRLARCTGRMTAAVREWGSGRIAHRAVPDFDA